jgi:hypothetical protein
MCLLLAAQSAFALKVNFPIPQALLGASKVAVRVTETTGSKKTVVTQEVGKNPWVEIDLPAEGSYAWQIVQQTWILAEGYFYAFGDEPLYKWYRFEWHVRDGAQGYRLRIYTPEKRQMTLETSDVRATLQPTPQSLLMISARAKGTVKETVLSFAVREATLQEIASVAKKPAAQPKVEEDDFYSDEEQEDWLDYKGPTDQTLVLTPEERQPPKDVSQIVGEKKTSPMLLVGGKFFRESFQVKRDLDYRSDGTVGVGLILNYEQWYGRSVLGVWLDSHGTDTDYEEDIEDTPRAKQKRILLLPSWSWSVLSSWQQTILVGLVAGAGMFPLEDDDEIVALYGVTTGYEYWFNDKMNAALSLTYLAPKSALGQIVFESAAGENLAVQLGLFGRKVILTKGKFSSSFTENGLTGGLGYRF